ncbi:hypothetical protein [Paenarthrobacter aurescens]|uniref:hypothetical protein n=1 Tax=Paenarthrobacter aurescens TaxID=43663 RepID=UPI00131EE8C3|nr:hypothetical protein [Paenarthrobacter aurescens]
MSAEQAAALIKPGMTVAMSGFTGAGYPKAVPQALAARMDAAVAAGEPFQIKVLTGASTAPNSTPPWPKPTAWNSGCHTSPTLRCGKRINSGDIDYIDMHLSHVASTLGPGSSARSTSP